MAVVASAARVTMVGAVNNQQKAAAGAAKMAGMAAAEAEVALAATAMAATAAAAVAVAAAETAVAAAIAMAIAEGKARGRGDRRKGLGVCMYVEQVWGSMYTTWRLFGANKSNVSSKCVSGEVPIFGI